MCLIRRMAACAVLGYAAVHFNRVHVDRHLVLKALALYSLVNTAVNLITRKGFGEKARVYACHSAVGHAVISLDRTLQDML